VQINTTCEPVQFQPRNVNQVSYFKTSINSAAKVSKDEFATLHELAYMLPGFVWSIITYPDLIVTCGMPFFTEVMQKASLFMLSYDTTFNLGDLHIGIGGAG
jgi:hypothetical protein